jgi:hypothetical protein
LNRPQRLVTGIGAIILLCGIVFSLTALAVWGIASALPW